MGLSMICPVNSLFHCNASVNHVLQLVIQSKFSVSIRFHTRTSMFRHTLAATTTNTPSFSSRATCTPVGSSPFLLTTPWATARRNLWTWQTEGLWRAKQTLPCPPFLSWTGLERKPLRFPLRVNGGKGNIQNGNKVQPRSTYKSTHKPQHSSD